jgi:outer membrane biogenesis lipoprotein LolB
MKRILTPMLMLLLAGALLSACTATSNMLTSKDCPNGVKKNNHKYDRP